MCMYVCTIALNLCVCVCVSLYVTLCLYVCMFVYVKNIIYVSISTFMYMFVREYVYGFVDVVRWLVAARMYVYMHLNMHVCEKICVSMGWLPLVGSLKLYVSFAEYPLFYRALLQKRPIILRSLLFEATPFLFVGLPGY